jgi:chaperone BCS1
VRLSSPLTSFFLIFLFYHSVDDSVLQRAIAAIPKNSIFLIEDIDCAFHSREDGDNASVNPAYFSPYPGMVVSGMSPGNAKRSNVTLSGLLNVLDGVGSEEGKLVFATVRCHKTTLRPSIYL